MENCLSGMGYVSFIACISPNKSFFQETFSTLKFGSRAKNIKS